MVGLSSYARFGHLESGEASNILEVVAEEIDPKEQPLRHFFWGQGGGSVVFVILRGEGGKCVFWLLFVFVMC